MAEETEIPLRRGKETQKPPCGLPSSLGERLPWQKLLDQHVCKSPRALWLHRGQDVPGFPSAVSRRSPGSFRLVSGGKEPRSQPCNVSTHGSQAHGGFQTLSTHEGTRCCKRRPARLSLGPTGWRSLRSLHPIPCHTPVEAPRSQTPSRGSTSPRRGQPRSPRTGTRPGGTSEPCLRRSHRPLAEPTDTPACASWGDTDSRAWESSKRTLQARPPCVHGAPRFREKSGVRRAVTAGNHIQEPTELGRGLETPGQSLRLRESRGPAQTECLCTDREARSWLWSPVPLAVATPGAVPIRPAVGSRADTVGSEPLGEVWGPTLGGNRLRTTPHTQGLGQRHPHRHSGPQAPQELTDVHPGPGPAESHMCPQHPPDTPGLTRSGVRGPP